MVSSFTPIAELAHSNSTFVLRVVRFNSATFMFPVSDSLFSANIDIDVIGENFNRSGYLADSPLKGVGCLEQVSSYVSIYGAPN
jgi:hypothetical protein